MSAHQTYTREIRDELGYSATWFPTVSLQLGDVGLLSDYEFQHRGTLKDFGISFKTGKSSSRAVISHSSANGVAINIKLAGQAPALGASLAQADAGIIFSFKHNGATVFHASGCSITSILNLQQIEQQILRLRDAGRWNEEFVIISEVVAADAATVLVAKTGNARMELRAAASVAAPSLDLLNVDGNFQVVNQSEMASNIVSTGNLTPLFRAVSIQKRLFRPDSLRGSESCAEGDREASGSYGGANGDVCGGSDGSARGAASGENGDYETACLAEVDYVDFDPALTV